MHDLYEDAEVIREEIQKEMNEYERIKLELESTKKLNKNLKKKLHDNSLDLSEIDG